MAKPLTTYSPSAANASALQWTLNSTIVTLNSITAYLNGYFTSVVPNQLSNKVPITYTAV